MDLMFSLLTILVTFSVILVMVNYLLRYVFENRYLNSKSEYLISNPLVQFLMMMSLGYWITQSFQSAALDNETFSFLDYIFEEKKALTIIFMLIASFGSILVTITSAMSLFHVFRRNGNSELLKRLSYIGAAVISLSSLLGLILFTVKGNEVMSIITFLIILGVTCWFEYMYSQSVNQFFKNGQELSYQEKIIALLEAHNTAAGSDNVLEKEKTQKYCPNCGERIDADSKVCPICSEETNF